MHEKGEQIRNHDEYDRHHDRNPRPCLLVMALAERGDSAVYRVEETASGERYELNLKEGVREDLGTIADRFVFEIIERGEDLRFEDVQ